MLRVRKILFLTLFFLSLVILHGCNSKEDTEDNDTLDREASIDHSEKNIDKLISDLQKNQEEKEVSNTKHIDEKESNKKDEVTQFFLEKGINISEYNINPKDFLLFMKDCAYDDLNQFYDAQYQKYDGNVAASFKQYFIWKDCKYVKLSFDSLGVSLDDYGLDPYHVMSYINSFHEGKIDNFIKKLNEYHFSDYDDFMYLLRMYWDKNLKVMVMKDYLLNYGVDLEGNKIDVWNFYDFIESWYDGGPNSFLSYLDTAYQMDFTAYLKDSPGAFTITGRTDVFELYQMNQYLSDNGIDLKSNKINPWDFQQFLYVYFDSSAEDFKKYLSDSYNMNFSLYLSDINGLIDNVDRTNSDYISDKFVDDKPKYEYNPFEDFTGEGSYNSAGTYIPAQRNYDSWESEYLHDELMKEEVMEPYYESQYGH